MTVVLGPCPCQGCGRLVTWNGFEWQEWNGKHACNRGFKWLNARNRKREVAA